MLLACKIALGEPGLDFHQDPWALVYIYKKSVGNTPEEEDFPQNKELKIYIGSLGWKQHQRIVTRINLSV